MLYTVHQLLDPHQKWLGGSSDDCAFSETLVSIFCGAELLRVNLLEQRAEGRQGRFILSEMSFAALFCQSFTVLLKWFAGICIIQTFQILRTCEATFCLSRNSAENKPELERYENAPPNSHGKPMKSVL